MELLHLNELICVEIKRFKYFLFNFEIDDDRVNEICQIEYTHWIKNKKRRAPM
jgi:predicted transcriptional regulator YdeE